METLAIQYKKDLLREIEGLPSEEIKEVLDFICFIKAKKVIDPAQTYFWSKKWQEMEREVDEDKKAGDIIGDGSVEGLLRNLKDED